MYLDLNHAREIRGIIVSKSFVVVDGSHIKGMYAGTFVASCTTDKMGTYIYNTKIIVSYVYYTSVVVYV